MSIDRIGKGPGIVPPAVSDIQGPMPTGAREAFKVTRASEAAPTSALDRVRAGEITVDDYVDAKVHEATAHLDGKVEQEQLAFIQASLREQMASDPVLVDLVRGATGAIPRPRE